MKTRKNINRVSIITAVYLCLILQIAAFSQAGEIISETVRGKSLEKTITRENPDRSVTIYLPPSYKNSADKRYPVLYLLHGIGDSDKTWMLLRDKSGFANIKEVLDKGISLGKFGEMIVVMPDQKTKWFGSIYVNSSVIGNWEDFTVKELVAFVDKKYRTIANAENRGIAGHSMGGVGAISIAMKHPEVFSVVFGLNPAIIDWAGDLTIESPAFRTLLNAKSLQPLIAEAQKGDIYPAGSVTVCRAYSPNPAKPPFYCDLPFKLVDGKMQPSEPGYSKWLANSPIRMAQKYRSNLMKLRGIRFDSGYEDEFQFIPPNARRFSRELTNNGIDHIFEEYNGDHRNRLWGRNGRLLNEFFPYFWDHLQPQ